MMKQEEEWGGEKGDIVVAIVVFGSDEGSASWLRMTIEYLQGSNKSLRQVVASRLPYDVVA